MPASPVTIALNVYNVQTGFGARGDGATDDTVAIAAAVTAAAITKGIVYFPPGTFIVSSPITIKDGVTYQGAGRGATIVKLSNGANCDVFRGDSFGTLTGTGTTNYASSGPSHWRITDVAIDGNRANQSGASYGVRVYGYDWTLERVAVRNCFTDGIWTEWGAGAGAMPNTVDGMDARATGLRIHDNGGWGWHHRGPNDSTITDTVIWANNQAGGGAGGLWAESDNVANSSGQNRYVINGLMLVNVHTWGSSQAWGMIFDGTVDAVQCHAEGASTGQVLIRGSSCSFAGGVAYYIAGQSSVPGKGIQLGDDGTTSAPTTASVVAGNCRIDARSSGFTGLAASSAALHWLNCNQSSVDLYCQGRTIPTTTVASGSNGQALNALTSGILNVASSASFSSSGGRAHVMTSSGIQTLTYTGTAAGQLTGCSASSSGTVSTGSACTGFQQAVWGTIDKASRIRVQTQAPGMSQAQIAATSQKWEAGPLWIDVGINAAAFVLRNHGGTLGTGSGLDILNVNSQTKELGLPNGGRLRLYSDAYVTRTIDIDGPTGHIYSGGATPGVAVTANAGTGATVSVAGTDLAGTITLNVGTAPALGDLLTLTFATSFVTAPRVVFSPANASAGGNAPGFYRSTVAGGSVKLAAAAAPAASTTYVWDYVVIR